MPATSRPLAIAHRGDPMGCVENTVPAVLRALDLGAGAVEVDLRTTADGVVVVHHDPTLERLWGDPGAVSELTLDELRRRAPQVPTLEEVLTAVQVGARGRAAPLVLDVGEAAVALAAYQVAERLGRTGAVWFCGDPRALAALRARDGTAVLMLTWESPARPGRRVLDAVRPTFFNPFHRLLSQESVASWQRQGIKVCAWTVDSPDRLARLTGWGIDAIIGNDVVALVAATTAGGPAGGPAG